MSDRHQIAAFSGGKDSTAMILAMLERGETIDELLITPTGDELPEVVAHWQDVADRVGLPLTVPPGPSLADVIESQRCLPNFRIRFCTRMIKITPAKALVARRQAAGLRPVMCVGLRADEPERQGIIDARIDTRFPLREFGMGLAEVRAICRKHGVRIPERTDCARCYHQRIGEWHRLWATHPDIWADAEAQEEKLGQTFRTPGRDSWPTSLKDLRAEFERGREPTSERQRRQLPLFATDDEQAPCRVCSL